MSEFRRLRAALTSYKFRERGICVHLEAKKVCVCVCVYVANVGVGSNKIVGKPVMKLTFTLHFARRHCPRGREFTIKKKAYRFEL